MVAAGLILSFLMLRMIAVATDAIQALSDTSCVWLPQMVAPATIVPCVLGGG